MTNAFRDLQGQDAYELLGVAKGSSNEEVNRLFRKNMQIYHPDNFPPGEAQDAARRKTDLLTIARDILINRRAGYDLHREQLTAEPPNAGGTPGPADRDKRQAHADEGAGSADGDPWRDAAHGTGPGPATGKRQEHPGHTPAGSYQTRTPYQYTYTAHQTSLRSQTGGSYGKSIAALIFMLTGCFFVAIPLAISSLRNGHRDDRKNQWISGIALAGSVTWILILLILAASK